MVEISPGHPGRRVEQERRECQPNHEEVETVRHRRVENAATRRKGPRADQGEDRQNDVDDSLHAVGTIP